MYLLYKHTNHVPNTLSLSLTQTHMYHEGRILKIVEPLDLAETKQGPEHAPYLRLGQLRKHLGIFCARCGSLVATLLARLLVSSRCKVGTFFNLDEVAHAKIFDSKLGPLFLRELHLASQCIFQLRPFQSLSIGGLGVNTFPL